MNVIAPSNLFFLLASLISLTQLVNISHIDGISSDFSNLMIQVVSANDSYNTNFSIVDKQDGSWALINVSVPDSENYSLNMLAAAPNVSYASTYGDGMIEISYFEGLNPDFSNLAVRIIDQDGRQTDASYTILGIDEGKWALIAIDPPPQDGESVSFFTIPDISDYLLDDEPLVEENATGNITQIDDGNGSVIDSLSPDSPDGLIVTKLITSPHGREFAKHFLQVSSKGHSADIDQVVLDSVSKNRTARVIVQGDIANLSKTIASSGVTRQNAPRLIGNGKYIALEINRDDIPILLSSGAETIFEDTPMTASLVDSIPLIRADLAQAELNASGLGVGICLLDTGVDTANVSGVIPGFDFVHDSSDFSDDNGHGTFMASVIRAIAPNSTILSVKVLDSEGIGHSSGIIEGIEYCKANMSTYNLRIIAMGFGGGNFTGYCLADPVAVSAASAVDQGMLAIASAGNDGAQYLAAPACGENVTAVSASSKTDAVSSFSNMNGMVDLLAPGEGIMVNGDPHSGTSSSVAHVAGAAALLLEKEPSLSPLQAETRFKTTGTLIEFQGANFSRIDVYNALQGNTTGSPTEQNITPTNATWGFEYSAHDMLSYSALIAYRSNTGSYGVNSPKIRFWNSTGNGSWGSEIELATAGSPVRYAIPKWSMISDKKIVITLSDDGNLDAYVCMTNCTYSASWTVTNNIGNVWGSAPTPSSRRFDVEFESLHADAMLIYGVNSGSTANNLAYKYLPSNVSSYTGITENYITDSGHGSGAYYSWVRLDRDPIPSEELALVGYDYLDNDINAWIWNGTAWVSQTSITDSATSTGGYEALAVRYSSDGSKVVAIGGDATAAGNIAYRFWNGTDWSGRIIFKPGTSNPRWMNLKADPSTDDMQAVIVTDGSVLYTAYWNGTNFTSSSALDSGLDIATTRPADFEWSPSGSTGRLVWDSDTTGGNMSVLTCSPQCSGTPTNVSTYAGTGSYTTLYRNPQAGDQVDVLGIRLNSANDLGSFFYNGSYANYGDSAITADTTTSSYESYGLAFRTQSACVVINAPGAYELHSNIIGAPINASRLTGSACIKIASSNVDLDCNGFNITNNGVSGTTYGILLNGSTTNVTVENCRVSNYTYGIAVYQASNSVFSDNTIWNNSISGFFLNSSSNTNITDSTVFRTVQNGISINSLTNTTLLSNITAYTNGVSILVQNSNATNVTDAHLFNDSTNMKIETDATPRIIWLTRILFDTGNGTYQNFTNFSMMNVVDASSGYQINWTTDAVPSMRTAFAGKYLNITNTSGNPSIDTAVWSWRDDEIISPYNESKLQLWMQNASGWTLMNGSANPTTNTLTLSNFQPRYSMFAIMDEAICPTIVSSGSYSLTRNATGAPNAITNPFTGYACVVISASNVVFDCAGYSINRSGAASTAAGIVVDGSSGYRTNVTIKNCPNISYYNYGVYNRYVNNFTLFNSTIFASTSYPFYQAEPSNYTNISNNRFIQNQDYLYLYYLNHSYIRFNTATKNNYGWYILYSDDVDISWNNVSFITQSSANAIQLSNTIRSRISNNTFLDNLGSAVRFDSSDNNAIIDNVMRNTSNIGVLLWTGSDYNTITNLKGNLSQYCLEIYSSNYNNASKLDCRHHYFGFYSYGSNTRFTDSYFYNNSYGGYYEGDNNLMQNCNITTSNSYGLEVRGNNATLQNSVINISGSYNLVSRALRSSFTNNILANSASYGFLLEFAGNDTVANNSISGNNQYGIFLTSTSTDMLIENNSVFNNSQYGIYVTGGAKNVTLSNNNISRNSLIGIYLKIDSSNMNLTFLNNNHLFNNTQDFKVEQTISGFYVLNATNMIFDNPYGNYTNYTNISIYDTISAAQSYAVNWARQPINPPAGHRTFLGKYVNISNTTPSVTIDRVAWQWLASELTGFNENNFVLDKYNASGWVTINSTPDTANNLFVMSAFNPMSIYGIMEGTDCPVLSSADTYVLNKDHVGAPNSASEVAGGAVACIKIAASNVVFDCAGYKITNNVAGTAYGILLNGSIRNVTIKNCNGISNYTNGIYIYQSDASQVMNSSAYGNSVYGFDIFGGYNNTITNSSAYNNTNAGFFISFGSNNSLINSSSYTNPNHGFQISRSSNNIISGSTAFNNTQNGFYVDSTSDNNLINNCTSYNNTYSGIRVSGSSSNNLSLNRVYNNSDSGIALSGGSNNNTLVNNTLSYNRPVGILVSVSNYNTLVNNTAYGNLYGIVAYTSANGNILQNNRISNSSVSGLVISDANDTRVSAQTLFNNTIDLLVNNTQSAPIVFNMSSTIFDSRSDSLINYTNLTISDSVEPNTAYSVSFASNASSLPTGLVSIRNKSINITAMNGSSSIDRVVWYWLDSESTGLDENQFVVGRYNGTWNTSLNTTPNIASNTLSLYNLAIFGNFMLLMDQGATVTFVSPTPPAGLVTNFGNMTANVSISTMNLQTFTFNWNGSNYTYYNDSLVLMLDFDNVSAIGDNSSKAIDLSRYRNNATIFSAVYVPGKYGSALNFSASSSQYASISDDPTLKPSRITVEAWIKPASFSASYTAIYMKTTSTSWNDGYGLYHPNLANNEIAFFVNSFTAGNASATIPTGVYSHVVGTYNGSEVRIYIDGTLVKTTAYSSLTHSSSALLLGNGPGGSYYFNGAIDEMRIYNYSLNSSEVLMHYQSSMSKYTNTSWSFTNNKTGLSDGIYTYYGFANNTNGYSGMTDDRNITIDYPPSIFNITVNVTPSQTGAYIMWSTGKDANGTVNYGDTQSLGNFAYNSSMVGWRNVSISGLTPNKFYYYNLTSCDQYGYCNTTGPFNFSTDNILPVVLFVPPTPPDASYVTVNYTTINVSVSENVSSCLLDIGRSLGKGFGTGSDGSLTVSSANTVVNNYTWLMQNVSAGAVTLSLNNSAGLNVNDEIMIIQMYNYSNGTAGLYEFRKIAAINGNSVNVTIPLGNSYFTGIFNRTNATATQVIRVPQYTNVIVNSGSSITASAWDGWKGGMVVFRATGSVTISGNINVTGKGYRGGTGGSYSTDGGNPGHGFQGESYWGLGMNNGSAALLPNKGGGGGGQYLPADSAGGGGGAGYAYNGTNGTPISTALGGWGGQTYGDIFPDSVYLGSGGGGGIRYSASYGSIRNGGAGGGAIMVFAQSIDASGSNTLISVGLNGQNSDSSYNSGAGGGSGGSVYLVTNTLTNGSSSINLSNGFGGTGNGGGGVGGNGSIGRFNLSGSVSDLISMTVVNNDASTSAWYNWTGLLEYANYSYLVTCTDMPGNSNSTANQSFYTDFHPPIISNITLNVTSSQTEAYVMWSTDENANGTVNFGLSTSLGSYAYNSSMLTWRNVTISVLPDKIYYYNLTSCDPAGNCNTTGPFNFSTDIIPPVILFVPPTPADNSFVNSSNVIINVSLNEDGSSCTIFSSNLGFSIGNSVCSYRMMLNFSNRGSSENLTDFPVLIALNSSRINYSKTSAGDIRFYDGSVLLPKETERWNSSGTSYVWVKVPQIDNTSTDFIYAYFNCSDSVADNKTAVWSNNYVAVYHLNEGSGTVYDSSPNLLNGTPNFTPSSDQYAVGLIDGTSNFTGSNDYVNLSTPSKFSGMDQITLEAWIRETATQSNTGVIGWDTDANDAWQMIIYPSETLYFRIKTSAGVRDLQASSATLTVGSWKHAAMVYNGSLMTIYTNGVRDSNTASITGAITRGSGNYAEIGRYYSSSNSLNGFADEIRISNVSRSASWLNASALSGNDSFVLFGNAEASQNSSMNVSNDGANSYSWFNWTNLAEYSNTTYYVSCTDLSGNSNSTGNQSFYTDFHPPSIFNITVNVTTDQTGAYIMWSTGESANGTVNYGLSTSLGSYGYNASMLTWRNVSLAGLSQNKLYYYNLTSCDPAGNCNTTGPFNFSTDIFPPLVQFVPPTPADNSFVNSSNVIINVSISENVSSCILQQPDTLILAYGDGDEGPLSVTSANTVVNDYAYLTGNASVGSATLAISDPSGFSVNDEILVIQMQNYTNGTAGAYEFRFISSIAGNSIGISTPLTVPFFSGSFNKTNATISQIVRIPHYTDVNVTSSGSVIPTAWNGYSGGILAFRASGTVNISGLVNGSGRGFRGGLNASTSDTAGQQGESYLGLGIPGVQSVYNALVHTANNGGGGAGDMSYYGGDNVGGGGGGASFTTNGTNCTYTGYGSLCGFFGATYGLSNLSLVYLGSGGGAGGTDNNGMNNAGVGGAGGAIIFITGRNMSVSGAVLSRGSNGVAGYVEDGAGGGGSGGSIWLMSDNLSIGVNRVNATNGTGGAASYGTNFGGDGGLGRIRLDYLSLAGSAYPSSYNGTPANISYGASATMNISNDDASTFAWYNWTGLATLANYTYSVTCVDISGNSNTTSNRSFFTDFYPPLVIWFNQTPADLSAMNIFDTGMNITYNISEDYQLNISSPRLHYKTNTSVSDCWAIVNGSYSLCAYQSLVSSSNQSVLWLWRLFDNQVYPATYNFDERSMETTAHSVHQLSGQSNIVKIRLFNVSNTKQYGIFEVMANVSSGTSPLAIYYCNSSYVAGNPTTSSSCTNFYNLPYNQAYNHSHPQYSRHMTIPFAMNVSSGKLGPVYVTSTSYFLLRPSPGSAWDTYYISNVSRADTIQASSNNGNAYSNFSGTVDSHLHQYDGTEKLWYYACANDTTGNQNCSDPRFDFINQSGIPPTAPDVYNPTNSSYCGNITINYTQSVSPNAYAIAFYNISLLNQDLSFNRTIISNNSLNLSYVWDAETVDPGIYVIRVQACDVLNQCSFGYSANFTYRGPCGLGNCPAITSNGSYYMTESSYGAPNDASELPYGGLSCIKISASNVLFDCRGFSITYDGSGSGTMFYGISINASLRNVTIKNCPSISNYTYGIAVFEANLSSFSNLTLHDNVDGLYLYSSRNNTVSGVISRNNSNSGFNMQSSSNNSIYGSTAYGNGVYGFGLGYSDNNTLDNNTAYLNGYDGFHVHIGSKNLLLGNTAYNNSINGFVIEYSIASNNSLINNSAFFNQVDGISVSQGNNEQIINNSVYNNSNYGIIVSSSANCTLSRNSAYENGADGIGIISSSVISLSHDLAYSNNRSGFAFLDALNISAANLDSENNTYGYNISAGSGSVRDNYAFNNSYSGFLIFIENMQYTNFTNNTAFRNAAGFLASGAGSDQVTFLENNATANDGGGFGIENFDFTDFYFNTASENAGNGFYLFSTQSFMTQFHGNSAWNNSGSGVVCEQCEGNFSGNMMTLNLGSGFKSDDAYLTEPFFNNTASFNQLYGFDMSVLGLGTALIMNNTASGNGIAGMYASDYSVDLVDDHYFNNTYDLLINATDAGTLPWVLNATRIVLDNPNGDLTNFTVLSIYDNMTDNNSYLVDWAMEPADPLPSDRLGFRNKWVNISSLSGTVDADLISWSWDESELGSIYNENKFELWKFNGTNWTMLNNTPDTSMNVISIRNVTQFSDFGILERNLTDCEVINSSGIHTQMNALTGAPNSAEEIVSGGFACVKIAASDVIYDCNGFNITYDGSSSGSVFFGILLNGSLTNVTVRNCPMVYNYTYGIYSSYSNRSSYANITLANNSVAGIYLVYSSYNALSDIRSSGNGGNGIYLAQESDYNNLTRCNSTGNGNDGFLLWASSYSYPVLGNRIVDSQAENNSQNGFHMHYGSYNVLENDTSYGNLWNGFNIEYSAMSHNSIRGSVAYLNSLSGFSVTGGYMENLTDNFAYNNTENGFYISGGSDILLSRNNASNNTLNGFYVFGESMFGSQANISLDSNRAYNNTAYGILVNISANDTLSRNIAYGNRADGIRLSEVTTSSLSGNDAHHNQIGIVIFNSTYISLSNETAYGNPVGIQINYSDYCNVTGSVLYGNLPTTPSNGIGIHLKRSSYGVISNNSAYGNGAGLAVIESSDSARIIGNNLSSNMYGMYVNNAYFDEFFGNAVYGNSIAGLFMGRASNHSFGNDVYFNNSIDIKVNNSGLSAVNVTMNGTIFAAPSSLYPGALVNYTNLSFYDSNLSNEVFTINWTIGTDPLPESRFSFSGKFVNITNYSGVSIDSAQWNWQDSELGVAYDESKFELWKFNGTNWTLLNDTPDTINNKLSVWDLTGFSDFGILERNITGCLVITENGTYVQSSDLFGAPNDASEVKPSAFACVKIAASDVIYDCNGFNITYDGSTPSGAEYFGVLLNGSIRNVTVRNCKAVANYTDGIYLFGSNSSYIVNSTLTNNTYGIYMDGGYNNTILNCTSFNNTRYGLYLNGSLSSNLTGNNVTFNTIGGMRFDLASSSETLSSNLVCWNGMDIYNLGSSNSGRLDRCDSFAAWTENGHYGCEFSCSDLWHRFFGGADSMLVLRDNTSDMRFYYWNASSFNLYMADIDSQIHWQQLQAIGRNITNGTSQDDFREMDEAFASSGFGDNITSMYSIDGSSPKDTRNYSIYLRPVDYIPVYNSTSFNTTFKTGILWDMADGGSEYGNDYNQSTVWMVNVNESSNDVYGTYDYLMQVPYTLSTREGSTDAVGVYVEIE